MAMKVSVLAEDEGGLYDGKELLETPPVMTRAEVKEKIVDAEVERFEGFFISKLGNENLAPSERAILTTYIFWALGLAKEETDA